MSAVPHRVAIQKALTVHVTTMLCARHLHLSHAAVAINSVGTPDSLGIYYRFMKFHLLPSTKLNRKA